MKKNDVWDEEINPDGISTPLKNLNNLLWNRGYFTETDDGIWYEMYVNDNIKKYYPTINLGEDEAENFTKFNNLFVGNYKEYNQITFFVANGEDEYTLETLEDILI